MEDVRMLGKEQFVVLDPQKPIEEFQKHSSARLSLLGDRRGWRNQLDDFGDDLKDELFVGASLAEGQCCTNVRVVVRGFKGEALEHCEEQIVLYIVASRFQHISENIARIEVLRLALVKYLQDFVYGGDRFEVFGPECQCISFTPR